MKREYKIFLKDILESMKLIEEYVDGLDFEEFKKDQKTVDAVVRNLEIIGEATKRIPQNVKDNFSNIPWKEMTKMRDKMIHGYFTIVHEILWETAIHDIPETKPLIKQMLKELD